VAYSYALMTVANAQGVTADNLHEIRAESSCSVSRVSAMSRGATDTGQQCWMTNRNSHTWYASASHPPMLTKTLRTANAARVFSGIMLAPLVDALCVGLDSLALFHG